MRATDEVGLVALLALALVAVAVTGCALFRAPICDLNGIYMQVPEGRTVTVTLDSPDGGQQEAKP